MSSLPPLSKPPARLIDGKAIAAQIRARIAQDVSTLGFTPGLAVILVGEDPASRVYVGNKVRACAAAGIRSIEHCLSADVSQGDIAALIDRLNADPQIHGILLQLPLPAGFDSDALIQRIDPRKDVDGLTIPNIGRLVAGLPGMVPCTPQGAMILIKTECPDLTGLHALVIGRSLLFGKPMAQLLLAENATVTQAHSKTRDLPGLCAQADILVVAAGRAEMIRGTWIKPGAIVIDVGINRREDSSLCGDVNFAESLPRAGAISPVPGGVGPMTIACLLSNTLAAAKQASQENVS